MLVVLDTNVLLSALISPHGVAARIYEGWRERRFELVTCGMQLEEIRRASRYPKLRTILKPHLVGKMLNSMQRARVVEGAPAKHTLDGDPADAYLLDLAEFSGANYLVTGDKKSGLLTLQRVVGTRILTPRQFSEYVLT